MHIRCNSYIYDALGGVFFQRSVSDRLQIYRQRTGCWCEASHFAHLCLIKICHAEESESMPLSRRLNSSILDVAPR